MNKPEETAELSSEIHFKKAKITLRDERQFESENVTVNTETNSILIYQDENPQFFNFEDVVSLSISNKNAAGYGALIGGVVGFAIPMSLLGKEGAQGGPLGAPSEKSLTVVTSIISTFVGLGIGYYIGSGIFINWQEYPLNRNVPVPLAINIGPPLNTMYLRWKIPLHRFKPY